MAGAQSDCCLKTSYGCPVLRLVVRRVTYSLRDHVNFAAGWIVDRRANRRWTGIAS